MFSHVRRKRGSRRSLAGPLPHLPFTSPTTGWIAGCVDSQRERSETNQRFWPRTSPAQNRRSGESTRSMECRTWEAGPGSTRRSRAFGTACAGRIDPRESPGFSSGLVVIAYIHTRWRFLPGSLKIRPLERTWRRRSVTALRADARMKAREQTQIPRAAEQLEACWIGSRAAKVGRPSGLRRTRVRARSKPIRCSDAIPFHYVIYIQNPPPSRAPNEANSRLDRNDRADCSGSFQGGVETLGNAACEQPKSAWFGDEGTQLARAGRLGSQLKFSSCRVERLSCLRGPTALASRWESGYNSILDPSVFSWRGFP